MTPPDSGEREVCGVVMVRVNGDPLHCERARDHDGPHEAKLAGPIAAHGRVMTPLPLAQRILAALEEAAPLCETENRELIALAAELRSRVPTKGRQEVP